MLLQTGFGIKIKIGVSVGCHTNQTSQGTGRKVFFLGLSLYVYIKSPNPKKPQMASPTGPKPLQLKSPPQNPNIAYWSLF